jgi:uncharacterized protein YkwD
VAGLALSACTPFLGVRPVTPLPVDAARTASLVSAFRAEHGLAPVGVDSRLMQAAAEQAQSMGERDRISHSLKGSLARRVSNAGYDWGATAENLGAGYPSLDDAVSAWKGSAGHRRNLLNPAVDKIGVAAVATPAGSKHRTYWALVLAGPRPERLPAGGPFQR